MYYFFKCSSASKPINVFFWSSTASSPPLPSYFALLSSKDPSFALNHINSKLSVNFYHIIVALPQKLIYYKIINQPLPKIITIPRLDQCSQDIFFPLHWLILLHHPLFLYTCSSYNLTIISSIICLCQRITGSLWQAPVKWSTRMFQGCTQYTQSQLNLHWLNTIL